MPEDPETDDQPIPPWIGPPACTLPAVLGEEIILATTERVAVCLIRLGVYPTGFEFELLTMAADDGQDLDPLGMRREPDTVDATGSQRLSFRTEYADGSTGDYRNRTLPDWDARPTQPVLRSGSGGGGGSTWFQKMWAWPLPGPERFSFWCEWPAVGIPPTRHELDGQTFMDAAARARVVFPEPEPPQMWGGPVYIPPR